MALVIDPVGMFGSGAKPVARAPETVTIRKDEERPSSAVRVGIDRRAREGAPDLSMRPGPPWRRHDASLGGIASRARSRPVDLDFGSPGTHRHEDAEKEQHT